LGVVAFSDGENGFLLVGCWKESHLVVLKPVFLGIVVFTTILVMLKMGFYAWLLRKPVFFGVSLCHSSNGN
jgi:hypothetical protein